MKEWVPVERESMMSLSRKRQSLMFDTESPKTREQESRRDKEQLFVSRCPLSLLCSQPVERKRINEPNCKVQEATRIDV